MSQEPIGRIAAERAAYVSNHVIGDPRIPDQEWARGEQLLTFAGYPLTVEDRTIGVLALFARRALSDFTCAPFSWLLANDVKEGRRELNFSKWNTYDGKKRDKKLTETAKEVHEGEMPPWYYVLVHSDARLTDPDRETLRTWTVEETDKLRR